MIELKDKVLAEVAGGLVKAKPVPVSKGCGVLAMISKTNISNIKLFNFSLGDNGALGITVTQTIG